jgi:hypothetical protein
MRLSARNQIKGKILTVAAWLIISTAAVAQEPVGCDKFKWPIDRERALLADAKPVSMGAYVPDQSVRLNLSPITDIKLPTEPSRQPKPNTYAGFVRHAAPPHAGTFRITLSEAGWIDVRQDGREIRSGPFSGVTGCEGVRKSVKFDLMPSPFIVEITGSPAKAIAIAVTPD